MRVMRQLHRWAERIIPLPSAIILVYHRVVDIESDPQLLCVSPRNFNDHLAVLRRQYRPISLHDLRCRLTFNQWLPRTVAITFDDGYADNLHNAKFCLETAEIPATVFVTAGQVDTYHEFWWDELESILLHHSPLPSELELNIDKHKFYWHSKADINENVQAANWHVLMDTVPTQRQALYLQLALWLRNLPSPIQETSLEQISTWAGRTTRIARPSHLPLNTKQLCELTKGGLVEIGAHTMTHPVLSALSADAQRWEINKSKQILEEKLELPVTSFAYPFGSRTDYTANTVQLVKNAGFTCACSNFAGHIHGYGYSHPYQLPRYLVRNWDGDEFACRLEHWFAS